MARAGTLDLLRAVSGAAGADAGEGGSVESAGRRRRRRAVHFGAGDVAAVPGAAPPARPARHRRPSLHLDLPGRDALADLCGARRLRQSVRRNRAGAGLSGDGGDHSAGQRVQRCGARALRLDRKALDRLDRDDGHANPLIWACVIGIVINVTHITLPKIWHEVADALGRSSLAIGLLVTGAGLHLEGMLRPRVAAWVAVFLKLVLMPVIGVALALLVRDLRQQSRHRHRLLRGAGLVQRLCAGPADGRRRAAVGADHHTADDFGGDHDAGRDCAGGNVLGAAAQSRPTLASPR